MHRITGCLLKEQRDIPVYSAIQQMATDFAAISYLTPALRLQISSWVYHHHKDTGKKGSIVFVSTASLQKKRDKNYFNFTPGELRCKESKAWMTVVIHLQLWQRK